MRPAYHKFSCRVDVIGDIRSEKFPDLRCHLAYNPWHQFIDDILPDTGQHAVCIFIEFVVLGRNHNRIDAAGNFVIRVFDGYLRLGIGPQIGDHVILVPHPGKFHQDTVRNIIPWSPAPCSSFEPLSTPWLMSLDCSWISDITPHESPLN